MLSIGHMAHWMYTRELICNHPHDQEHSFEEHYMDWDNLADNVTTLQMHDLVANARLAEDKCHERGERACLPDRAHIISLYQLGVHTAAIRDWISRLVDVTVDVYYRATQEQLRVRSSDWKWVVTCHPWFEKEVFALLNRHAEKCTCPLHDPFHLGTMFEGYGARLLAELLIKHNVLRAEWYIGTEHDPNWAYYRTQAAEHCCAWNDSDEFYESDNSEESEKSTESEESKEVLGSQAVMGLEHVLGLEAAVGLEEVLDLEEILGIEEVLWTEEALRSEDVPGSEEVEETP